MKVIALGTYVADASWRENNESAWVTARLVSAVKRRKYNSSVSVRIGAEERLLQPDRPADADTMVAELLAPIVRPMRTSANFLCITPVPGSAQVSWDDRDAAPYRIAKALSAQLGFGYPLRDILRMREPVQKATDGGTRDPVELFRKMQVRNQQLPSCTCILVDDVMTSGGHLRAAAARLRAADASVAAAVCVAITESCVGDCFEQRAVELPDDLELQRVL